MSNLWKGSPVFILYCTDAPNIEYPLLYGVYCQLRDAVHAIDNTMDKLTDEYIEANLSKDGSVIRVRDRNEYHIIVQELQ